MPAKLETQEYVKNELPYKILMYIYKNSRAPLKVLGREFNISYHTVSAVLKALEKEYRIEYTLELDENRLGFSEGRLITIKFEKTPEVDFLNELFQKDIFVQDAYLASGDFDLLLYVVGLSKLDFQYWQFNLRIKLSKYKPTMRFSTVTDWNVGFLPLRNEIINHSTAISELEKKILTLLNEDSRMKLKELIAKSKVGQMRVIYAIKKLREAGIIKKFTALTQRPDKGLRTAYGVSLIPQPQHKTLWFNFADEILKEDLHEATNDYSLVASTNGIHDAFYICNFEDGGQLSKRGPDLMQKLWVEESPRTERAILTALIVGKWPFHLEKYDTLYPEAYGKAQSTK